MVTLIKRWYTKYWFLPNNTIQSSTNTCHFFCTDPEAYRG